MKEIVEHVKSEEIALLRESIGLVKTGLLELIEQIEIDLDGIARDARMIATQGAGDQ